MTIINLDPLRLGVTARSFRLRATTLSSVGMFDGETNASLVIQRWITQLNFPPMAEVDWLDWEGLIDSLGGMAGRMRLTDPQSREPRYNRITSPSMETFSDGSTFTDGSGFSSGLLPDTCSFDVAADRGAVNAILRGLPPSVMAALVRGDKFEHRPAGVPAHFGLLYRVVRQANTDAAGKSGIEFVPPLRANIAAGDMCVLKNPTTVMRLASDNEGEIEVDAARHGRFGLSLVEVLPNL